jgi:hypothetical protein
MLVIVGQQQGRVMQPASVVSSGPRNCSWTKVQHSQVACLLEATKKGEDESVVEIEDFDCTAQLRGNLQPISRLSDNTYQNGVRLSHSDDSFVKRQDRVGVVALSCHAPLSPIRIRRHPWLYVLAESSIEPFVPL